MHEIQNMKYKTKKYVMEKYEHLKKYIDYTWHIKYSAEREEMHANIIDLHFKNMEQKLKPKILFSGGCYGSGKGHTLRYLNKIGKIVESEWICADPDKIRIFFPEYTVLINSGQDLKQTNKEAGYIVELIEYYALENGYNIIIDGSLHDYMWQI